MRSNGVDVKVSSLGVLDLFMEPGRSARIRCSVCRTMQKVDRGLMVKHDDCAGSHTHYDFDLSYTEWSTAFCAAMNAQRKRFDLAVTSIDPKVRHATRVSPVRYPDKPVPLHRQVVSAR